MLVAGVTGDSEPNLCGVTIGRCGVTIGEFSGEFEVLRMLDVVDSRSIWDGSGGRCSVRMACQIIIQTTWGVKNIFWIQDVFCIQHPPYAQAVAYHEQSHIINGSYIIGHITAGS